MKSMQSQNMGIVKSTYKTFLGLCFPLSVLIFAMLLPSVQAAFIPVGDVSPADPATWTATTVADIGKTSYGSVTVNGDSDLKSSYGRIGYNDGVTGQVLVTDAGSTWTLNNLYAGVYGNGTVDIMAGGSVSASSSFIGYANNSIGVITVSGGSSTLRNTSNLYVGYGAKGTLNISNGANVSVVGTTYVGFNVGDLFPSCTGEIHFDTGGGTLTTGSLSASPNDLTGTGTINATALVCDTDLVFNSSHGLKQTLLFNSAPQQNITINLDMSGTPKISSDFGAGFRGRGSLAIADGVTVNSGIGYVGHNYGSQGVATIVGNGSKWTPFALYIGEYGDGSLNITNGGTVAVTFASGYFASCLGAETTRAVGRATVDGMGSTWANDWALCFGYRGTGILKVSNGGLVTSGTANDNPSYLGYQAGAVGLVSVVGNGSRWNSSSNIGIGGEGKGTLEIVGGGAVTTLSVTVGNSQSLLAIDVGRGSSLTVGTTLSNSGTVRLLAGAGVSVGNAYSPIISSTWSGSGAYQPVGGTWNSLTHKLTVLAAANGSSGTAITGINLASIQRVLVSDNGSGALGASFLASPKTINFTATAISGANLSNLETLAGNPVLSAWELAAKNYSVSSTSPLYLSLKIGSGWSESDLDLWQYNGSIWSKYDASDLTYDGVYASFTATNASGFAVSVPEPGTLALLGCGLFSFLVVARCKKRPCTETREHGGGNRGT
jgi:large repetitive protein